MGFYVGIDLGTTNSTVSVIQTKNNDDSPLEALFTCPIYQYGARVGDIVADECLPSALYFDIDNRRVYTGRFAKITYATGERPLQTALSIKTRMGGDSRLTVPSLSGTGNVQIFDMKECASFFIRTIVDSLKKHFPKQGDRITDECVVTVPAAFNDDERVATQNAVLLGGFKHCTILDEPTAALLSYINGSTHDEDNDDEDARKISTISNKLASNIYVRNADGKFTLLIPSDLSCTSGTFHYTITDDNVAYFPFYLYSGTEPEGNEDNTDTFTQLAGRMIRSKPEYKKGDKIPINWSIDDNKVITVQIQNDKNIRLSRLLTPEEIAKNLVKDYQVNR